jgi:DNA-binding response OmpR family regulator
MVVLLDLNMPGMDGFEVLRTVETNTNLSSRHAYLVLSARARTLPLAFTLRMQRLRIPVLAKPFDLDTLFAAIAAAAVHVGAQPHGPPVRHTPLLWAPCGGVLSSARMLEESAPRRPHGHHRGL